MAKQRTVGLAVQSDRNTELMELADSCRVALTPLCREFMRGGMSAQLFLQVAKLAYVQVAAIATSRARGKPNVSRIAAATGLNRRDISALLDTTNANDALKSGRPIDQPVMKVLREWRTNPRFLTRRSQPRALLLDSSYASFQSLVRCCAGDVTPVALLKELEREGVVSRATSDRVKLLKDRKGQTRHRRAALRYLSRNIADQANAITNRLGTQSVPVFAGSREIANLNPDLVTPFLRSFAERANGLLENFDQWVNRRGGEHTAAIGPRVGIGVYVIHESAEIPGDKRAVQASRAKKHSRRKAVDPSVKRPRTSSL